MTAGCGCPGQTDSQLYNPILSYTLKNTTTDFLELVGHEKEIDTRRVREVDTGHVERNKDQSEDKMWKDGVL